jgi:hypothetical protein
VIFRALWLDRLPIGFVIKVDFDRAIARRRRLKTMKSGGQHVAGLRDGRTVPVKRLNVPVAVGPGATALTHTPELAASSATDFVTACLLAA